MATCIAIIGCGSIGSRHIDTLLAMGYQDLVGVETRPMPHDERLPIVGTLDDTTGWKPTHAVICTPPEFHYQHAKYFLDRGIRTFIEKPMTTNLSQARTLCAIAHTNKQEIAVGYMERAHPIVIEARKWVDENIPSRAEFFCYWRATKKTYQCDVVSESSHAIDTALFVMGEAPYCKLRSSSGVRAEIVLRHVGDEDTSTVIMDMDAAPRRRIQMYAGDDVFSKDYGTDVNEWDACYKAELEAFLDGNPLCTGEDGVAVMEVLERVR